MATDPAANLRAAREAAGWPSVSAAARAVGLLHHHVARLERGERRPSWATMVRLISGLNLGLEWFYAPDQILAAAERIGAAKRKRKGRAR